MADDTRPEGETKWFTPQRLVWLLAPAPTATRQYYKIFWLNPETGARESTTAGTVYTDAVRKAVKKETDLLAGATATSERAVNAGIDYWLDPSRPTPRRGWSASHRRQMNRYARQYLRPQLGKLRCMDLRRKQIQAVINLAPNLSEGDHLKRACASLLGALRQGEFLMETQLLDTRGLFWHGVSANDTAVAQAGVAVEYVPPASRPSHDQVRALRQAAFDTSGGFQFNRALAVELSAYSGVRWGELMALTADKIGLANNQVKVDWQLDSATYKLERPKMRKRRVTLFPDVTPTGFELRAALEHRLQTIAEEQAAGRNRLGLLFPTRTWTYQRPSNWHRTVFEPAATAAGWPYEEVERPLKGGTVEIKRWQLTWHSLRHTFATVALEEWGIDPSIVAQLAGHSNPEVTRRLYVGTDNTAIERARQRMNQAIGGR